MGVPDASDVLDFALLPMQSVDYPSVSRIFTQGIETGNATYDTSAAVWEDWDAKHLMHSRWVVKSANEGSVLGWAALSPVSSRVVFSVVAELSIYVDTDYLGKGLGNVLMEGASAEAVKSHIKSLIDAEGEKILSDDTLVDLLTAQGFDIARRTVAKYREAMGIGSSVQRRRQKKMGR